MAADDDIISTTHIITVILFDGLMLMQDNYYYAEAGMLGRNTKMEQKNKIGQVVEHINTPPTPSKSEILRKIGFCEKILWRGAGDDCNVIISAKISGDISVDELENVIIKMKNRHVLLGARTFVDVNKESWFIREGHTNPYFKAIQNSNSDDRKKIIQKELRYKFPTQKGPLIRFLLVKSENASDLIINAHHLICDGSSLVYLLRDILYHLSNPNVEIECKPVPPSWNDSLPQSIKGKDFYKNLAKLFNFLADKRIIKAKKRHNNRSKDDISALCWMLAEQETATLISRCREEKVTVNTAICAAFLAAQWKIQGGEKSYQNSIMLPINIRDILKTPIGEEMGMYASMDTIKSPKNKGVIEDKKDFWNFARNFQVILKDKIYSAKTNLLEPYFLLNLMKPDLLDWILNNDYNKEFKDRIGSCFLITNVGKSGIPEEYGDLHLKTISGPYIHNPLSEKSLGAITHAGRLSFSFSFLESIVDTHTMEKIRDSVMDYLKM